MRHLSNEEKPELGSDSTSHTISRSLEKQTEFTGRVRTELRMKPLMTLPVTQPYGTRIFNSN